MNREDFETLFQKFKDRVYNTVLSYVQNTEDAEEITQDVFVEIYYRIDTFRGDSSISTWIYRIAVNKSIDCLKHRNRKKRFAWLVAIDGPEQTNSLPDFYHPGVVLEQKEQAAILFKIVQQLPQKQKTAFILKHIESLSQKEIAEILSISQGAVESLLQRAKVFLRQKLGKQ